MKRKPARRKPSPKRHLPLWLLICLLLITTLPIVWYSLKSTWDKKSRLSFAIAQESGEVALVIADPHTSTLTIIGIPPNTQVDVAHQLGSWKLASVYRLGQQENLDGQLLADTITKSLKLPIDHWASAKAAGFISKQPLSIIKAAIMPYHTSFTFKDKLKLASFSLNVKKGNYIRINLIETGYLESTRLTSGEEGYLVKKNLPSELIRLFSVREISQAQERVGIVNATGNSSLLFDLNQIIEVLGTKVVSSRKEEPADSDCQIRAHQKTTAQKIARVLHCQLVNEKPSGNLDVEIILGTRFLARF